MLTLHSKSEDCAKHVRVPAGQSLSEKMIGVEKCHLIFMQAMVSICCQAQLFSLVVSIWLVVCGTGPKLC